MNVLVSGSHGLIGGALVRSLTADGHVVVALVRPGASAGRQGPGQQGPGQPGAGRQGTVAWDPERGSIDREALERHGPYDAAVHLAGAGIGDRRWSATRRRTILASRVDSTHLLAGTLLHLDRVPRVLVSASAVGYYGDRGDDALTEESGPGHGFLADVCRSWEAATAGADEVLRVVHLRTGIVLSRQGGALARQLPLFRLGVGGRLGSGRQYVSWITLDDEVSVIRRALDDDRLVGPVNATAPEPVTNSRFTRALAGALHRPAVLAVPGPALALALGGEMARELLLTGQRVLPARLTSLGHEFAQPDIDAAVSSVLASGH